MPAVSDDGGHLEESDYDACAEALKPNFTDRLGPAGVTDHALSTNRRFERIPPEGDSEIWRLSHLKTRCANR